MKRAFKIGIVLLLLAVLLGGAYLYFFVISPKTTASILIYWGNRSLSSGSYERASTLYRWAYELDETNSDVALSLAEAYADSGNYTRAEYVLLTTKKSNPDNADLYLALSKVFVSQDKLLDAQLLLDNADPSVLSALSAMRPAAPVFTPEAGFYTQYIDLSVSGSDGDVYVSLDEQYPSMQSDPFAGLTLPGGITKARAIAVRDGLVSPLTEAEYTITGVIEPVVLQDSALDAYVRELLFLSPTQKLMSNDLWEITALAVPAEVRTLDDLHYFIGLETLSIPTLCGSDLSFLAQMPALHSLSLSGCTATTDILETVSDCTGLTQLDLSDCGLTSIAPLGELKKLEVLNLSENFISNLTPLNSCTALRELNLRDNAVTDPAQLAKNTALTILDLSSNALDDCSGLKGCVNLQELYLNNNSLEDIPCISAMQKLRILEASKNKLLRVDSLGSCTKLERLDLSDNVLETIAGLENLTKLVYLNINYNDVKEIPDMPDDCCLQQIYAAHNFLEDLEGLKDLLQLNYVDVDYNNVDSDDLNWLLTCPMLVQINAFGTNVDDIEAFEDTSIIVNYDPT